jgi:outer membrane protein
MFIVASFVISIIVVYSYHIFFTKKTVYIEIEKVFNEFEMKKEMGEKYKAVTTERKKILDSLSFDLNIMSDALKKENVEKGKVVQSKLIAFQAMREDFLRRKEQDEAGNLALTNQYDAQILERMNQYIKEYGVTKDYNIILGANASGSIMYCRENLNISNEVVIYINKKYKGE